MNIQGKLQFHQMKILMRFLYLLKKATIQQYPNLNRIDIQITKITLSEFIDCLQYLVGRNIGTVLGDFNINEFEGVRASKEVFSKFNLKVSKPTHLDGALLDHVNIKKTFENDKHVTSIVNNVYFSDHDSVKVQIRFKDNNPGGIDFNITD